jgi:hypothetical protein
MIPRRSSKNIPSEILSNAYYSRVAVSCNAFKEMIFKPPQFGILQMGELVMH